MGVPLPAWHVLCILAVLQTFFLGYVNLYHSAAGTAVPREVTQAELELANCLGLFPGLAPVDLDSSSEIARGTIAAESYARLLKSFPVADEQAIPIHTSSGPKSQNGPAMPDAHLLSARGSRIHSARNGPSIQTGETGPSVTSAEDAVEGPKRRPSNLLVFSLIVLPSNASEDVAQWEWRKSPGGGVKGDDYGELLRWCLRSLVASGPVHYELLFLVNEAGKNCILAMEEITPFVTHFYVMDDPFLQSTDAFLPKLRLIEALEVLDARSLHFDRILMLDADVLARGPVSKLLQKIEKRDRFYVKPERAHCRREPNCLGEPAFSMNRYTGVELFCLTVTGHVPINGGSFGFRDGPVVRRVWRALQEGVGLRNRSSYMDQPIFNHILLTAHMTRPGGLLDFDLFDQSIRMTGEDIDSENHTLVHFNFDGQASKLDRMREYYGRNFVGHN